jgi:hypothetical protein
MNKKEAVIVNSLLACYYDPETKRAAVSPFVGAPKDSEIRRLWEKLAKTTTLSERKSNDRN